MHAHCSAALAAIGAATLAVTALAAVPSAAAPPSGRPLTTTLTGAAEVPGPGDPDATGTASLRVNPGLEQLCYTLTAQGIDGTLTGAHVHVAPADDFGPIVVPLTPPVGGTSSDCVHVDRKLAIDIVSNPEEYYVNVHSTTFRAGAIRGQLG